MNILITNFEIIQYSGSEINAVTIAKRFKQLGYTVYMTALDFGDPLLSEVKDESIDVLINLLDSDFDFSSVEFDIVWAHHSFLLDWLIFDKNLRAKKIINSSLSPVEVFEVAPLYANDINLSIVNSKETEARLIEDGITNTYLLENYSFIEYFKKNIEIKELKNIAIVSNHVPDELFEVVEKLKENNYNVQIYGIQGKRQLVTDKVLEKYDVIITIGKTVQYAMSLKIPVYIYDKFGGSGYLTMDNMELNRAHNFSGRGYEKKQPDVIYNEIIGQFTDVLQQLEQIKQYARDNFCFEDKIEDVLHNLENMDNINLEEIRLKYKKYMRNIIISKRVAEYLQRRNIKIINDLKLEIQTYKQQNNQAFQENEQLIEIINRQKNELDSIKGSRSWKYITRLREFLYKG